MNNAPQIDVLSDGVSLARAFAAAAQVAGFRGQLALALLRGRLGFFWVPMPISAEAPR